MFTNKTNKLVTYSPAYPLTFCRLLQFSAPSSKIFRSKSTGTHIIQTCYQYRLPLCYSSGVMLCCIYTLLTCVRNLHIECPSSVVIKIQESLSQSTLNYIAGLVFYKVHLSDPFRLGRRSLVHWFG